MMYRDTCYVNDKARNIAATADTSGESLGSELALRADDASASVSRFTSSCQGRVLADPGQPPDGGKLIPKEALTRSVRFLGSSPSAIPVASNDWLS